ncbi:hypothetical protein GCU67_05090 [Modestobacter muralis]|uniref:Uncharacterized protein n=1 Tax=Modestobacter muralis TaxID=1608614 RepID=A0A6P0EPA3_9ACTN|nr:hypothetical protein [Modestobacter muralis]NEN50318.1 hypothetical protein [Modestobacter muralis]
MSTTRSNRAKAAITTVSLTGAAMGFLTACGAGGGEDDNEAREVYCVDEQDNVVDEDQCEEAERNGGVGLGGLPFFFLLGSFGGNRYSVGQRIPQQYTTAGTRVNPSDTAARSRSGLPSSGKVTSGTRVSGGIGSGSAGGSSGS